MLISCKHLRCPSHRQQVGGQMTSRWRLSCNVIISWPRFFADGPQMCQLGTQKCTSHTHRFTVINWWWRFRVEENKAEQKRGKKKIEGLSAHLCALSAVRPHTCTLRGAPIVPKRKGKVGGEPRLWALQQAACYVAFTWILRAVLTTFLHLSQIKAACVARAGLTSKRAASCVSRSLAFAFLIDCHSGSHRGQMATHKLLRRIASSVFMVQSHQNCGIMEACKCHIYYKPWRDGGQGINGYLSDLLCFAILPAPPSVQLAFFV